MMISRWNRGSAAGVAGKAGALALTLALVAAPRLNAQEPSAGSDEDALVPAAPDCTFQLQSSHATPASGRDLAERLARATERVHPSERTSFVEAPSTERSPSASPGRVLPGGGGASGPPPQSLYKSFIDAEIFSRMAAGHVQPTGLSSDSEFLRRVFLDLTGQIPDVATVKAFLADTGADKRDRMIDTLLASDAFVDRWTMWFGDLVENVKATAAMGSETYVGRNAYSAWIRQAIQQGKPYDQMVRELVGNAGDNFLDGPPNFWVRQMQGNGPIQDTYDNLFAQSGEKFLGLQCICLSCHNGAGHTDLINVGLSTKTRMQFWQSASFFAMGLASPQTDPLTGGRKYLISDRTTGGGYILNTTSGNKTTRAPVPGQSSTVAPVFMLTGEAPKAGQPLRSEFARMLTSHPQFARAAANYLWKEMMGLGIVEPANNFDLLRQDPNNLPPGWSVQPSHPGLLDKLAAAFQGGGYDLRAFLRTIATSKAYQLSSSYTPGDWNTANASYYPRRLLRRLPAEMLFDAIVTATGVPAPDTVTSGMTPLLAVGISRVTRAMQLPDTTEGGNSATFLNVFTRGNRDGIERSSDVSAVQALSMMNDSNVVARCRNATAGSNVQRTLKATTDPSAIADSLYIATLGRYPSDAERTRAVAYLKSGALTAKTEDLQFALLNELEFLYN